MPTESLGVYSSSVDIIIITKTQVKESANKTFDF